MLCFFLGLLEPEDENAMTLQFAGISRHIPDELNLQQRCSEYLNSPKRRTVGRITFSNKIMKMETKYTRGYTVKKRREIVAL
jgi:hypothetical protein